MDMEGCVAKLKFDGVIEAVHYRPDGQVEWARTYLRRGPTFSDYILLDRQTLLEHLNAGKKFYRGERILLKGGEFNIFDQIKVVKKNGQEYLVTQTGDFEGDQLEKIPVI